MANAQGVNPARHEIERQLERMLAHPLFRARGIQADIFAFLVESYLAGKEIDELALFNKFYNIEKYKAGGTHVRAMVSNTRGLLKEYYDGDGKNDPVIIALPVPERSNRRKKHYKIVKRPAGKAYAPEFCYNPRAPIAKQFAIASYLLGGSPSQLEQSLWKLDALIKAEPDHPEAVLRFMEGVAAQVLFGNVYPEDIRPHFVAGSLLCIAKLKGADAWRVHNVRGLIHLCAGDMNKAKKEFTAALKLDRHSTIVRGWYTLYLLRTGKEQEAVKLMGLVAEESASNAQAQAVYGLYLSAVKRYDEAERAFSQSLALDRNCWSAHYGMAQMYQAIGNKEKASEHTKRLEALVEPAEYRYFAQRLFPEPRGQRLRP